MDNSASPLARIRGLIPCAEDWHTKFNLLDVSWSLCITISVRLSHLKPAELFAVLEVFLLEKVGTRAWNTLPAPEPFTCRSNQCHFKACQRLQHMRWLLQACDYMPNFGSFPWGPRHEVTLWRPIFDCAFWPAQCVDWDRCAVHVIKNFTFTLHSTGAYRKKGNKHIFHEIWTVVEWTANRRYPFSSKCIYM